MKIKLRPSYEAIKFQGASVLGMELTSILEETHAFKKSIRDNKYYISKTIAHFKSKGVPKIEKAIKKHLKLTVKETKLSKSACGMFACMMRFGDGTKGAIDAYLGRDRYSGGTLGKISNKIGGSSKKDRDEMYQKMADLVDTSTGSIKAESITLKNGTKVDLKFDLYLDPYMMFFPEDVHENVEPFTPMEITAIIIHELGHMISMLEYCGDKVRQLHDVVESVSAIESDDVPDDEKVKQLKAMINTARGISKGHSEYNEHLDTAEQIIDNLQPLKEDSDNGSLAIPIAFILRVVFFFLVGVWLHILAKIFAHTLGDLSRSIWKESIKPNFKVSDFMENATNNVLVERYADEFVVRHGFTAHLISGLAKFDGYAKVMDSGFGNLKAAKTSSLLWTVGSIAPYMNILMGQYSSMYTDSSYEPDTVRSFRALQNQLKAFKQADLSSEVMDFYIQIYEESREAHIEAVKINGGKDKLKKIFTILWSLTRPTELVKFMINGTHRADYGELLNMIEGLKTNELLYQEAKLNQLAGKM